LIEEENDKLTFKYKMARGTAMKSYGVYAAQLAGLPKPVVRRAEELLGKYENENLINVPVSKFTGNMNGLEKKLSEIDTDNLSPVEALMKIYELKNMLEENNPAIHERLKAVS
jgi:DNA mismatch repair protein MutS